MSLACARAAADLLLKRGFDANTVQRALALVGEGLRVDRVYVFENELDAATGALSTSQRYEWCAGGVEAQIDNPELQDLPFAMFGSWLTALTAGEPIAGPVRAMADDVRELLESQQIRSVLVCPIMVGAEFWGFIGFDDCTTERAWPSADVAVLRLLANSLASALRRARLSRVLESTRTSLQKVLRAE